MIDGGQPLKKRRRLKLSLSKPTQTSDYSAETDNVSSQLDDEAGETAENEAYFSANFKSVCSSVLAEDSPERHVFTDVEAGIVKRFMDLPGPQQQLYVRLFLRKHQWLRVSKLKYDRIAEDLVPIAAGLAANGFLSSSEDELADGREALGLLQVPELKLLCKELKMPASLQRGQKSEIIVALLTRDQEHKPLFGSSSFLDVVLKCVKRLVGSCVCIASEPADVFSKCLILYSLITSLLPPSPSSSSPSWTDDGEKNFSDIIYKLLQVKTGQLVFSEYEVYVTEPLFKTAEEFSRFYRATKNLHSLVMAIENKEDARGIILSITQAAEAFGEEVDSGCVASGFMERVTTGWVLAKILTCGVEYLEKQRDYRQANSNLQLLLSQRMYGSSYRGHWLERLTLNLDYHLGETHECLEVIRSSVDESSLHPAKRLSLLQRAHKLCQHTTANSKTHRKTKPKQSLCASLTIGDFPQPDIISAPEIVIEARQHHIVDNRPLYAIPSHDDPDSYLFVSVEGLAMHHYNTVEAWPCAVHAEKSTFSLMFSLLMWDIIFCSGIPNVFRTKLQAGPLDLLTDDFYTKRRDIIETRLQWINSAEQEELAAVVGTCWEKNHSGVCFGADWEVLPAVEDAKSLAMCMGGELLSRVCRQFARFYSQSCGGLPDLTLWNPALTTCKFVEVKGPGDRLSCKQIVWLSRLSTWGCQVEVCRVRGTVYLLVPPSS